MLAGVWAAMWKTGCSPDAAATAWAWMFFIARFCLPVCNSCSCRWAGGCRYLHGGFVRWHLPCVSHGHCIFLNTAVTCVLCIYTENQWHTVTKRMISITENKQRKHCTTLLQSKRSRWYRKPLKNTTVQCHDYNACYTLIWRVFTTYKQLNERRQSSRHCNWTRQTDGNGLVLWDSQKQVLHTRYAIKGSSWWLNGIAMKNPHKTCIRTDIRKASNLKTLAVT